jgi:hypothetical protein
MTIINQTITSLILTHSMIVLNPSTRSPHLPQSPPGCNFVAMKTKASRSSEISSQTDEPTRRQNTQQNNLTITIQFYLSITTYAFQCK